MKTINIDEARAHLSCLVKEAAEGNAFIIAKAGKPMVKVTPLSKSDFDGSAKLGFMAGEITVPDDFDTLGAEAIHSLFQGGS
jgi:prevent-host-death family protein